MHKTQKLLGQILIGRGFISAGQLDEALKRQHATREFLGRILLDWKIISERELLEALSEQFNISLVSLKSRYINWAFVSNFSPSLIFDYKCMPLCGDEESVTVAVNNPLDVWLLDKMEAEIRPLQLKVVLATKEDIEDAISRYKQYLRGSISKIFEE